MDHLNCYGLEMKIIRFVWIYYIKMHLEDIIVHAETINTI